jgi:hypothetical protein
MPLQDRDALRYALVTDMCSCARDKPSDRIGLTAAKRAAQTMRAPPQQARKRDQRFHFPFHPTESRIRPSLAMLLRHLPVDSGPTVSQVAGVSSSSSWKSSSRETVFSVTLASSTMKSTTFSSNNGARMLASADGFLR